MSDARALHRSAVGNGGLEQLREWTRQVAAWPAGSHVWGQYAERTPGGDVVCRTENVSACHSGFRRLVGETLASLAREHLGSEVVDFKDKINYKQPGGAGFSPHQDLVAYPGATSVVSVLLAVDECSVESGCLWLADGVDRPLATDDRGVVREDIASALSWYPAELEAGDALLIDGLLPHRSEANRSARERRLLVASYAPALDGYTRDAYYSRRRTTIERASATDGRFRISTLADFEGQQVPASPAPPQKECTHS